MSVQFNERKATQVAARFLAAEPTKKMYYIRLLKLMYFLDREALKRWGTPVTDDTYYSFDRGPILSNVKNLMVDEDERHGFWSTHISSPSGYRIELLDEAGDDQLSRAEERLIDEVFAKYRHLDRWQLIAKSHDLPEWRDPQGSSIKIDIKDILAAVGTNPAEIDSVAQDLEGARKMHALCAD
jgi:uncharacterized phage-associated protein